MPSTTPATRERHPVRRVAVEVLVLGLLAALLIPTSAFAGKGGANRPSGGGSVTGPILLMDADGNGVVSNPDNITFNVSVTASDRPFVGLRCYQGSSWVYDGYVGYFSDYMFDPWFTLSGPYWDASASATCTARLFYYNKRGGESVLSTLTFPVAP